MIRRESADVALRNFLWNGLSIHYFGEFEEYIEQTKQTTNILLKRIWVLHY